MRIILDFKGSLIHRILYNEGKTAKLHFEKPLLNS